MKKLIILCAVALLAACGTTRNTPPVPFTWPTPGVSMVSGVR